MISLGEAIIVTGGGRSDLLCTSFLLPRGGGSRCWSRCWRRGDSGGGAGAEDLDATDEHSTTSKTRTGDLVGDEAFLVFQKRGELFERLIGHASVAGVKGIH
jgi:hypothetical protein